MHHPTPSRFSRTCVQLAGSALLVSLAACGGGGGGSGFVGASSAGGSSNGNPGTSAPQSTKLTTTVIDGPLQGVKVCMDRNVNGVCDEGEPFATTAADGSATFDVANEDLGRYPLLAEVGAGAIDADTGAVPVAFTMKAPAGQTAVVSPLTTLVQAQMDSSGSSSEEAAAAIQAQLGLSTSVLANFATDGSDAGKLAATIARLIVVVTQQQKVDTAHAVGVDGQPLTSAQIDQAISGRMLQMSQTLATAVLDNPDLANAGTSITDKQAALDIAARQVADAANLTAQTVGAIVAAQTQVPTPEPIGEAVGSLRWFTFTDASNYYLRAFAATASQNTPDADGKRYATETRETVTAGVAQPWVRNLIYWTGSEWFTCPTSYPMETRTLASGEAEGLYCGGLRNRSKESVRDISGQSMRDTVQSIRAYPLEDTANGYGPFTNWGPRPDQISSTLTWPAGSTLTYRTTTDLDGSYYQNSNSNRATIPPLADPGNPDTTLWRAATLAEFIAWNAGDFAPGVSAADVHGNNSRVLVSHRDYLKPNGDLAFKRYMVGFESGGEQRARFYECEGDVSQLPANRTLFINGVSTCKTILVSNYVVETQGDAKVLRFTAEPLQLNTSNAQNYRLFVERNGVAYVGFRTKQVVSFQQRLNNTAANALLGAVGISARID